MVYEPTVYCLSPTEGRTWSAESGGGDTYLQTKLPWPCMMLFILSVYWYIQDQFLFRKVSQALIRTIVLVFLCVCVFFPCNFVSCQLLGTHIRLVWNSIVKKRMKIVRENITLFVCFSKKGLDHTNLTVAVLCQSEGSTHEHSEYQSL